MEPIVIALIGLELIAAIRGIVIAVSEGKEQADALERIGKATTRSGNMNLLK